MSFKIFKGSTTNQLVGNNSSNATFLMGLPLDPRMGNSINNGDALIWNGLYWETGPWGVDIGPTEPQGDP